MTRSYKTRLSEICEIKHGYAFKGEFFTSIPNRNILLTPGNIEIGGGFKRDKFKYYKGDIPKEYILKPGDLIVTMTDLSKNGDTLGYSALIPKADTGVFLHNQRLGLVQLKSNAVDRNYIHWVLRTREYQQFVVGSATGSTVKHTSPTRILEYEVDLPDLSTQTRIATILSSLDDKIELNRQMNYTLEQMAQVLFRNHFLDEIDSDNLPEGWRMGKLGDVCRSRRESINPRDLNESENYVGLEHIDRRSLSLFEWGTSDNVDSQKTTFNRGDILFGKLRPYFHKVVIAPISGICSTDILVISPKSEEFRAFCLMHLSSTTLIEYCTLRSGGTRMPRVNWSTIADFEIAIPPNIVVFKFDSIVIKLVEQIISNIHENRYLIELRNSLMPKLIFGEIELSQLTHVSVTR